MSVIGPVTILEPHGFIELQKVCADDLDVVNAAKVSFAKYSEGVGDHERGLIGFLMRENHGSPFEHTFFKFRVRAPIAVARDWVRHRIGTSWNEESGRYVQLRSDFYVPAPEHIRTQSGKPGSYFFEPISSGQAEVQSLMDRTYSHTYEAYSELQSSYGVAKELARYVLPVGIYSEWIFSCNARSLMHFLTLRNAPDAMLELRLYAAKMQEMFSQIMPVTAEWFIKSGG